MSACIIIVPNMNHFASHRGPYNNKHKDFLHQTIAGYVADSTENKFGPLTTKHLPTPIMSRCYITKVNTDILYNWL